MKESRVRGECRGLGGNRVRVDDGIHDRAEESQRRVAQLEEGRRDLLQIVAHDLKSPLVAIQGFAQLLRVTACRGSLSSKQESYVEHIIQAALGMRSLLDRLVEARRVENGLERLDLRAVDPRVFGAEVLKRVGPDARQKGVELRLCSKSDVDTVCFDAQRMVQVVGDLVSMAVEGTPSGGVVDLKLNVDDTTLQIEVSHGEKPGGGACPSPGSGKAVDNGFALKRFSCREIVRLHGGCLEVEGDPGGVCRYRVKLPRRVDLPRDG